ncbi:MAG: PQ-loop domain-containing transporter [Patescibacteria group bacterium]
MISEILAYVGTGLVIIAYFPQIFHLIREKRSAGISLNAYYLWGTATILFLIHAIVINDWPFIIVQCVALVLDAIIIFYTIKYQDA